MEHSRRIEANEIPAHLRPRMKNPAWIVPEAGQGIQRLISGSFKAGVPA